MTELACVQVNSQLGIMKIFVAHSGSESGEELAMRVALWLRDQGHEAYCGDELCTKTRRINTWSDVSIFDPYVDRFFSKAELLIALCIEKDWHAKNVLFEIGYFLRLPRWGYTLPVSNKQSVIVVKGKKAEIPSYLRDNLATSMIVEHDHNEDETLLFIKLAQHIQEAVEFRRRLRRRVFISYASEDVDEARKIYEWMRANGYNPWFDRANLIVGQDWNQTIINSIQDSVAFIACFSSRSVDKRGYFQRELRRSLEVAAEYPDGAIFILPVRLDGCDVPSDFQKYQWCDFTSNEGFDQLKLAIDTALQEDERRTRAP